MGVFDKVFGKKAGTKIQKAVTKGVAGARRLEKQAEVGVRKAVYNERATVTHNFLDKEADSPKLKGDERLTLIRAGKIVDQKLRKK